MRILRSIHSLNPAIGGPIESVRQSSALLTRWGHAVEIATLDAPDALWLRDVPVRVHAFGPARGSYSFAPRLTEWLRAHHSDFDAVIVHGLWQYSSFGVWRALRGTGTPYFVFPHGMLDPWFKRAYRLKHVKKLLYWPWAEYRVLRDAAAVLFTSEAERRLARGSFTPYRCNEKVVSYGTAAPEIDLEAAGEKFLNAFPASRGKRILLFLGRIHEKKGCDLLVQAFAQICRSRPNKDLHLVLAGPTSDEHYMSRLRSIATDVPVTFTGMLRGELKWGAFRAADAFVLPSHQENFGIAVVEALACGTPVLISNQVNIWREIVDDGAGLAEDDTQEGVMRLLENWVALKPAGVARFRLAAAECFRSRFELAQATESLLEVLQGVSGRVPAPAETT